ncbi:MAG: thymidylate kinase [Oscillospiraceae bacterium]|nr:thymidylate kinase [Oscillospiraceae bacterium]
MSGKLIIIEGLDGSGKSTQWEMLKKTNGFKKKPLFLTFPDYDSESGRIIKRYLAGEFGGKGGMIIRGGDAPSEHTAYSASSFYAIDRYISYMTSWGKAYKDGVDVISARYTSSNAIYQMTKLPEEQWCEFLDWLYDYEHEKLKIPVPDLTIFLDVPVEMSQELLAKRYEKEGAKDIHEGDVLYLKKCREAALYAAQRDNWVKIDCVKGGVLRSPDDINRELTKVIGGV